MERPAWKELNEIQSSGPLDIILLPEGLDFLLRPVAAGWIKYTDLLDGSVDLADIADINDALAVYGENERRMAAKAREG